MCRGRPPSLGITRKLKTQMHNQVDRGICKHVYTHTHTLKHTDTDTHPESSEGIHVGLGVQRRGFEAHEASRHD